MPEMIPELQVEGRFPMDETGDRPRADQVGDRMKKTKAKSAAKVIVKAEVDNALIEDAEA